MVQLFVSHISEEKDVAILLKDMMEEDFLGLVEFFASSDVGTIELGVQWLEAVERAIAKADAVIVLCSKASVQRPWVQFEVGAAWMKGLPIIPVCHSGMKPTDLATPLKDYEGADLGTPEGLLALYQMIGRRLKLQRTPVPGAAWLARLAELLSLPPDDCVQFEYYLDVVVPAPGRLGGPSLPGDAVVDMSADTKKLFGLISRGSLTWKSVVDAVAPSLDKRWLAELQNSIYLASNDREFVPIQAVFHAGGTKGSFQPQLAKLEVFRRGARRFHVHLVPTVVAPLFDVPGDLGLLVTLLRLGLRFRYEAIEHYWKMSRGFKPEKGRLDALRCAIEVIETDARSRGAQNFEPGEVVALFEPGDDQSEMKAIQVTWETVRATLFQEPPPTAGDMDEAIEALATMNLRFMHLGTKRFHEMVNVLWSGQVRPVPLAALARSGAAFPDVAPIELAPRIKPPAAQAARRSTRSRRDGARSPRSP
ncbi:toll/interleukin-1 receptor domain-containing protein [Variovorax sp. J22P271]|uniref:toll/interleukin-1 receptor domain-containing protein n=1 Tax=Variovorax davisae TaxID=3053515 RepID=UPI002578E4ED|nr:toll/interleukin-1 receptor domain-containing protein [Variovorax sp. J22P271]MDM0037182.1 toll/interleukin-1 receptor domain-containing protein [Variovorax sp. J22P271]